MSKTTRVGHFLRRWQPILSVVLVAITVGISWQVVKSDVIDTRKDVDEIKVRLQSTATVSQVNELSKRLEDVEKYRDLLIRIDANTTSIDKRLTRIEDTMDKGSPRKD